MDDQEDRFDDFLRAFARNPARRSRRLGLRVGEVIDQLYRLQGLLGEGGFGQVWEVEHLGTGRRMALKALRAATQDDEERFEREILTLARMEHAHITALFDEGRDDRLDCRYFVMELVRGAPFSPDGLSAAEVLGFFDQLLAGLAHAHAKGFVHRDLKPVNVFRTDDDAPLTKIMDFGIARAAPHHLEPHRPPPAERPGEILGTLPYMSPEQVRALPEETGLASDLYTVGVMLYEALCGALPFVGSRWQIMHQHLRAAPPPLLITPTLLTGLAPLDAARLTTELTALVTALLAKRYTDRPETAAEVRRRLTVLLTHAAPYAQAGAAAPDLAPQHAEARSWRLRFIKDSPPFGRDRALEALNQRLAEAIDARAPVLVHVRGAAGQGKSRLVRHVVERARERGLVRALPIALAPNADLPTALHGALYRHLRHPRLEAAPLRERLTEVFGEAPDDRLLRFMLGADGARGDGWAQLSAAVLARRAAYPTPKPLLVWLDGGAGATAEVAPWLRALLDAPALRDTPLLLLWSCEPLQPDALDPWLDHPRAHPLHLSPLSPDASAALAAHLTPGLSPTGLKRLAALSAGNPLFIRASLQELARADGLTPGPEGLEFAEDQLAAGLEEAIDNLLARLIDEARDPQTAEEALHTLALLGPTLPGRLARDVLAPAGLLPESLARLGWLELRPSPGAPTYAFASEVTHQVALKRARRDPRQLAARVPEAIEWRQRDALQAMIRSDWEGAIASLQQGWRLLERHPTPDRAARRLELLDGLAQVHYRQRDVDSVTAYVARLDREAASRPSAEADALATLWHAIAAWMTRDMTAALLALDEVEARGAPEPTGRALLHRGWIALAQGRARDATAALERARLTLRDARAHETRASRRLLLRLAEADATLSLAEGLLTTNRLQAAQDTLQGLLGLYRDTEDLQGEAHTYVLLTRARRLELETLADPAPEVVAVAEQHLDALQRRMEALDDRPGLAMTRWEAASLAAARGDRDAADRLFTEAGQIFATIPDPLNAALCLNARGELAREAKRLGEARDLYAAFLDEMVALDNPLGVGLALTNLGWLARGLGDTAQAQRRFEEAIARLGDATRLDARVAARVGLAAAAQAAGAQEIARASLTDALALVGDDALHDPDALAALASLQEAPALKALAEALQARYLA